MQTSKILQIVRNRWSGWIAARAEAMEPLDHPSLRGMSARELADLPLERWGCGREVRDDTKQQPQASH